MKKVLLYYCYCYPYKYEELEEHIKYGYEMHFYLLEHYKDIFNEVQIVLGIDNQNNPYEILKFYKEKFTEIFKDKKLEITLIENDPVYRDAMVYKYVFAKQLEKYNDCLLFFAQAKGLGNVNDKVNFLDELITIYEWVYGLYYFNLENPKEVELLLTKAEDYICYGSMFLDFSIPKNAEKGGDKFGVRFNKTKWIYSGSFQWINVNKLKNYIKENSINLDRIPIMKRFFSEDFLGNILPVKYAAGAKTYRYYDDYNEIDAHIKDLYPDQYMDFLNNFTEFFQIKTD